MSVVDIEFGWFNPGYTTIRVVGPDAISWLNGIVTCDVTRVRDGKAVWGALLTKQGKIQAEFLIVGHEDELLLAVEGGDADELRTTLDGYLVMEDAELEQSSAEWTWAFGPSAARVVTERGLSSFESDRFLVVARLCLVTDQLRAELEHGGDKLLSEAEFEELRIRSGIPRYGVDFDARDNLHAAGLERRVVDWQKGCYLGQEVVCMQEMRGKVRKRLVRIESMDQRPLRGPGRVETESFEPAGRCTSAKERFGMALLAAPFDAPGTKLFIAPEEPSRADSAHLSILDPGERCPVVVI